MAREAIGKMFGGVPGEEIVGKMMLQKMRKEMAKLDEETLGRYLLNLEMLGKAIRTGEHFEELMEVGVDGD